MGLIEDKDNQKREKRRAHSPLHVVHENLSRKDGKLPE